MKHSASALMMLFTVMTLLACQAPTSPTSPISTVPNCTHDYAEKRNKVVTEVSMAFLNVDLSRVISDGNLPANLEIDPAQTREKLVAVKEALGIFLNENKDTVCKGLVLKCKAEYAEDPWCYMNTRQSDWGEQNITNESLVGAYHSLEVHLSKL